MKYVNKEEAVNLKNSKTSELLEYSISLNDKDIDCAVNIINGRYPEEGYCSNLECKELVYVLEGTGSINMKDTSVSFNEGDVILIDKGDVYFWEGNCKIIMICTPAWYKEQCKLID